MKSSTSDTHSHSADDDCSMDDTSSRRASPSMEPPSALPNGSAQAAYAPAPAAQEQQQRSPPPPQQHQQHPHQQQHGYPNGSGYHYPHAKDPRDPRYYPDHHPQQAHTARHGHGANGSQSLQHPAPSTPSPPLPSSAADVFLGRTLPPIGHPTPCTGT
ncbi:unnamed protein product [Mortierella alpina]